MANNKPDYVTAKSLPAFREDNKPRCCEILAVKEYKAVVDHDHHTGQIRGVISSEGNVLIGKIENCFKSRCSISKEKLPTVLRNIAKYLEKPQGPYHPVGVRQLVKRFNRKNKKEQIKILLMELSEQSVLACKNSSERSKLYRKMLLGD